MTGKSFVMRAVLALALLANTAGLAQARCAGVDLRAALSAAERAALDDRLADIPFAEGNHWRAERGDQVIHLIGTIHLDDPRLDPITERLKPVIAASQMLLLEVTPAEEAALKEDMATRPELLFMQGESLPELMPEEDWDRLSREMQARSIPPMVASRFQPWYLSVLLAMPPCLMADMAGGAPRGLDHRLRDVALEFDIPLRALEPHDTLFQLFADDPLPEQIEVMMLGLATADQSLDGLETVVSAFYDENHAEAWEMSRKMVLGIEDEPIERLEELFAKWEADLLVARNTAWIPVILSALEGRSQITVAAGAGHLSGKQGVLALLEAEGFSLQRLDF